MRKKLMALALVLCALALSMGASAPKAEAATETVTVTLFFNIGAVDELTVTLLGEAAATSSPSGQALPANIEFNSTDGDTVWQNASVTNGGSTQDSSNAIIQLDNTGTTNLLINMSLDASINACLDAKYSTSFIHDVEGSGISLNETENATLDASFTPAESVIDLWLFGNFTGCSDGDDDSAVLTWYAVTV
jgi:hypothetical protein